jgi:hypothetical protein
MQTLPLNASARLLMRNGSPCSIAEFVIFAEQCGYEQDVEVVNRFVLNDGSAEPGSCAIELDNLSSPPEAITVFGLANDHFSNLNYLMQKAGWSSCSVTSVDEDINVKLLSRLVSVEVLDPQIGNAPALPASSLQAPVDQLAGGNVRAFPAPAHESEGHSEVQALQPLGETQHEGDLLAAHERISGLVVECNRLEERVATLEGDNNALATENAALRERLQAAANPVRATSTVPADSAPSAPDALLRIIEKFLLPKLDLSSDSGTAVLSELESAGYAVQLRLVIKA